MPKEAWFAAVERCLPWSGGGVVVGSSSMGGVHLVVLCRTATRPYISSVDSHFEPTGVGGVGYNKGGLDADPTLPVT